MTERVIALVTAAGRALEHKQPGITLEQKLKAAFIATRLAPGPYDDEQRFHAGIDAVFAVAKPAERDQIRQELIGLQAVDDLLNGMPLHPAALSMVASSPVIGLRRIWYEVCQNG